MVENNTHLFTIIDDETGEIIDHLYPGDRVIHAKEMEEKIIKNYN